MFTKDKLEKWIEILDRVIICWFSEDCSELKELKNTLEQIYTTITKED
jgi:hypothetical protein